MPKRTPEEIQAQRDAWMARKAARAAGQDVPLETPAGAVESASPPEAVAEVAPEPETSPELVVEAAASEPAAAPAPRMAPEKPAGKRSPEEMKAQREAFLAAKAAKAAGVAAPPPPAPKPVEAAPTPAPAPRSAEAAKPAPRPQASAPAAPRPAPTPPAPEKIDPNVTRREFLNYAWLASLALFTVETIGISLWFAFPNFLEGQFGGKFPIGAAQDALPEVNAGPKPYTEGKFWLVNVDTEGPDGQPQKGVLALYKVCVHLGCLYEWIPMTNRFECPCHGSKYQLWGDYISGPARRDLDRFVIQAVGPDGTVLAETNVDGDPLILNGDETLVIDTGRRILGHAILTPA